MWGIIFPYMLPQAEPLTQRERAQTSIN